MKTEEVLKRLEEIEAELGDSSIDHYPAPNTITQGHLRRLYQGTRELFLARLHKLEKVAEAARELVNKPAYRPELQDRWHTAWSKLREALAGLEEEKE